MAVKTNRILEIKIQNGTDSKTIGVPYPNEETSLQVISDAEATIKAVYPQYTGMILDGYIRTTMKTDLEY